MDHDDIDALLRLVACGGAAAPRRTLLERFGSASALLRGGPGAWKAGGLSDAQIDALQRPDRERLGLATDWLSQPDHHLVGWPHPDYPPLLKRAPNPPPALFVAGDPLLLWHPSVAVVGSRAATPAGIENAARFSRELAASGLGVASGLAAGIDTAAHEATLAAGGVTLAVLGTGPDRAYPPRNASLHRRIAETGALVSEHLPGTGARPEHFPSRNRILAGMALGTLVVEAAERSGALITARLAAEAGREVFAIPGSIHNPMARGCHRLIRDGVALVEDPREVADGLAAMARELAAGLRLRLGDPVCSGKPSAAACTDPAVAQVSERVDADPDYQKLWKALGHDPTDMDQLVARTGLTAATLSSMLLLMELDGRVSTQHGRYFRNR